MSSEDLQKLNNQAPQPELPQSEELPKLKGGDKNKKRNNLWLCILVFIISFFIGTLISPFDFSSITQETANPSLINNAEMINNVETQSFASPEESAQPQEYIPEETYEKKIIQAVKNASPSVVSIIISKDISVIEYYYSSPFDEFFREFLEPLPFEFEVPQPKQGETQKVQIGAGSGFIISKDGMILTNKHVVEDEDAAYTVITQDENKYQAKVLARDPIQDLAILKIEGNNFEPLTLGDSSTLEIGQTAIAIGNALGEFENTVSVGVISGLGRTITASSGGMAQTLEDVIQTDAAINQGNSGGPLLNLKGEVIGINTAMALGGENIGFAIPINKAKKDVEQIKTYGKISAPYLGIRYIIITSDLAQQEKLPVDYGALIISGGQINQPAVVPGSPAAAAGLREGDIILEIDNQKVTQTNSVSKIISQHNPGDRITLKVLREKTELTIPVTLGEWSD